jgi:hypothetical protein
LKSSFIARLVVLSDRIVSTSFFNYEPSKMVMIQSKDTY